MRASWVQPLTQGVKTAIVLLALTGCATRAPMMPGPVAWPARQTGPSAPARDAAPMDYAKVAAAYTGVCAGGDRLSNNCAHFLGDALIRAGHTDLLTSPLIANRCPAGRPMRAQDLLKWFQHNASEFHQGIPENAGWWFGYQEKPGRRHVLLLDSNTGRYYGTDHCTDWPVQWFYRW